MVTGSSTTAGSAPTAANIGQATSQPISNRDYLRWIGQGALWIGGWYLAIRIEFGSIYLIISVLVAIFHNLSSESTNSSNKNRLSAYSVFNTGAKRIAGSMDAESFENEIRHKPRTSKAIDLDLADDQNQKEHYVRKSKAANQPCVCGSGKKYKNCCSPLTASSKAVEAEWEEYDKEWGRGK